MYAIRSYYDSNGVIAPGATPAAPASVALTDLEANTRTLSVNVENLATSVDDVKEALDLVKTLLEPPVKIVGLSVEIKKNSDSYNFV